MANTVIQKKICMLGSFSVGKTSLVQRYVNSMFSAKYQTTVGVKIDKKQLSVGDQDMMMMLWDIAGEDKFATIRPAQLRGMSAYVLVIDGTRMQSFDIAMSIREMVLEQLGNLPMVFALNKADLHEQWVLNEASLKVLSDTGHPVLKTSAKMDQNVEAIFLQLGRQLVDEKIALEGI
ncbi:MAG: Rab family GTPase [Thiolinea sp.]